MSISSSQADDLRTLADKLRDVRLDDQVNYAESVETMFRAIGAMRDAADTIESLRDRLQAAELGSGECVMNRVKMFPEHKDCIFECWECSACKRTNDEHRPRFCPNCGARVRKKVGE